MKIKSGFELRDICGEHLIISHGIENINFTKVVSLNESASFLWKQFVGKEFTIDDMVASLLEEYDVTEDVARADCQTLADKWIEGGFVEK